MYKHKGLPIRGMFKTIDQAKLERVKQELNVKVPEDWYNVSQNVLNLQFFFLIFLGFNQSRCRDTNFKITFE